MAHAILRLAPHLALALTLLVRPADALPNALPISETSSCRVSLTKLSYDGPGADDEEFIELVVERFEGGPGHAPPAPADAGPKAPPCNTRHPYADSGSDAPDAAAPPDTRLDAASGKSTLADCGLGELRLVNGGAGACDEYRTIPLGPVVIPDDGYVVLCAQDSIFFSACDVDTAGRSALRNGFLQNGPADGLKFVGVSGAVALEVGYEGAPACFLPGAIHMVDEIGELPAASGVDDVNVACGDRFELRPAAEAPFRAPNPCRAPPPGDAGDATPSYGPTSAAPGVTAPPPEFAPDSGASYQGFSVPDAGLALSPRSRGAPAEPPSCRVSTLRTTSDGRLVLVIGVALSAALRRRKPRRTTALRADCSARFATELRRSP